MANYINNDGLVLLLTLLKGKFDTKVNTTDLATASTHGVVQIGSNIQVSSGLISVSDASTSTKGVVQLSNSISSDSESTAATSKAVKDAYDLANSGIETVQQNGTDLVVTNRTVNVTVPTRVSDLSNDLHFIDASATVAKASQLENARTISLSGAVTGTATSFDGSQNITIPTTAIDPTKISSGTADISISGTADKATKDANGATITSTYLKIGGSNNNANLDLASFKITGLADGTLATDAVTLGQLNSAIAGINQFTYIAVDTLPTASASTMYKIYLVPNTDAGGQDIKDEYITILTGSSYVWEKLGNTSVDLSDYLQISNLASTTGSSTTTAMTQKAVTDAISSMVSGVSGVKGNAETDYRTGNVNLTPANIGAVPLNASAVATNNFSIIKSDANGLVISVEAMTALTTSEIQTAWESAGL